MNGLIRGLESNQEAVKLLFRIDFYFITVLSLIKNWEGK